MADTPRQPSQSYDGTLADALVEAKRTADEAEASFRALLREANERGASTRDMAKLLDMSHSTLWRWMGGKHPRRDALAQPYKNGRSL